MDKIFNYIPEISTFIASCGTIFVFIKKWLLTPLKQEINELSMIGIKTDLVNFINDVENGVEKTSIQKLNAHELYDKYSKLGGNSYVHEHWNKLVNDGRI